MHLFQLIMSLCFVFSMTSSATAQEASRRIYLNGIDISSAVHQELKNVNVKIDGQGNLFIEAPHYQVIEESKQLPLIPEKRDKPSVEHRKQLQPLSTPDSAVQDLPVEPKIDRPADTE